MIVGISGKLGAGKDTVAEMIQKIQPDTWQVRRFAHKLKEVVSVLTNTPLEDNFSREGKQKVPPGFTQSLGSLQQLVGVALREHVDYNVWVNVTFSDMADNEAKKIIVTDLRFKNEAKKIKELGGVLIRIEGDPTEARKNDARNLQHISEVDLDDYPYFDYTIYNDGTLTELEKKVRHVLSLISQST